MKGAWMSPDIRDPGQRVKRSANWRRFVTGALAAAAVAPGIVLAANVCSPMVGRITLNEYNYIENFTEVKRLDSSVNLTGWKVTVYTSNRTASGALPTSGVNSCGGGAYQVNTFNANETGPDADIVLFDSNNDVVDILRVRTSSSGFATAYYPHPVPSCGYVSPPYSLLVTPANKGVDRSPDGVGNWRSTPGTGSGSFATRCGGNTPGGSPTDLRVTKSAGAGTILVGANVTFTITATNLGPNPASTLVVTDALPAGLAYVSHSTTAGTYSPTSGLWTLASLAVGASQTLTLTANGTSSGIWINTATVASDNPDPNTGNNTASASVTVSQATPSAFNAFESATAAGATAGVIRTRVAGTAFNLDVVAISGGAQAHAFNNPVRVELLGNVSATVPLDVHNCPTGATVLQTVAPNPTLNAGRATVAFAAVPNAWKDVRVRVSYPATGTPTVVRCSTDNFAIRPASLANVIVSDTDSTSAGTARSLTNTAASGGVVHKAGRPFRIAATAVSASGAATSNYAGSPAASLSACLLPVSGCVPGTLATGVWNAAGGTVTTTSATYSEVGALTLKLVDEHFADVDLGDSTPAERFVESATLSVGRFVPDHFVLAPASTPQFKTFNDLACGTRSFTYVGQPFGYLTSPQATITARNTAGAVTQNYVGPLWKLGPAGATQTYSAGVGALDTGLVGTAILSQSGGGAGTLAAHGDDVIAFVRSTPVAPFAAEITLSMAVRDEAENAVAGNGIIDTASPAVFANIAFDAGSEIRFGRLALTHAHGSELLALPVAIETQHWNGSHFVRNVADACTQLAAGQVALSNWRRDLAACETSVNLSGRFVGGRGNLRLGAPGAGNTGSVDLTVQLGASASGSTCVGGAGSAAGPAAQPWLQGAWTGGAYDRNPSARASFGLFRGSRTLIYQREMY